MENDFEVLEDNNDKQEDLKLISRGCGVVVKEKNSKPFVAEVLTTKKANLDAAKLVKEDNIWKHQDLVTIKRKDIVYSFPFSGGDTIEIPEEARLKLDGNEAPPVNFEGNENRQHEEQPRQPDEEHQDDPSWKEDVVEDGEGDLHQEDESLDPGIMLAARAVKAQNVSENKSKNQIAATREEIANGSHKEADLKELRSFFENKVLGPKVKTVTENIKKKLFSAGWRRTWKGDGNSRVAKSRLFARGFEDKRDRGWLETYSGTMDHGLMKTAITFALNKKWKSYKADVKTAFLQTDSDEELYFKMPQDLPVGAKDLGYEAGAVYLMKKAVYGRIDSPRLFTESFKRAAADSGWSEIAESILVHSKKGSNAVDGLMLMHMDDLICLAADPRRMLEDLHKTFKLGELTELTSKQSESYTGLDFIWDHEKGQCEISQGRYIDNIQTDLSEKEKKKVFSQEDLRLSEDSEIKEALKGEHQSWTGVLGWCAKTQPHLSVIFSEISRNSTRPSERSIRSAKRACEYAKQTKTSLLLRNVEKPVLVWWVDASYSLRTCDGRVGYEVQVVDEKDFTDKLKEIPKNNLVSWRSLRCKRKLASTTSALTICIDGRDQSSAGIYQYNKKFVGLQT